MGAYLAIKSRNLIPFPYYQTDKTGSGITYKINNDGSININGTATAYYNVRLISDTNNTLKPLTAGKKYTLYLKGTPGASVYCNLIHIPTGGTSYVSLASTQTRNPITFTMTDGKNLILDLYTSNGYTANNLTVYPMLVEGSYTAETMPAYEPYYTYKRVKALTVSGNKFNPNGGYTQKSDGVSTTDNTITCINMTGSADKTIKYSEIYPKGTYKFSANAVSKDSSGNVDTSHSQNGIARIVVVTNSQVAGFQYNSYYGGYFKDLESGAEVVFTVNEDFKITFPFAGGKGLTKILSNITLQRIGAKCSLRMRPTTFPDGYQRVEYIETNVNTTNKEYQYIDTGVIGKSPMTAETKMMWLALSSDAGFLGSRTESPVTQRLYPFYQYPNATWNIGYKENRNTGVTIVANTDYVLKSVLTKGKQEFYVDGVKVWSGTDNFEVDTGYPLRIFGYRNGDQDTTQYTAKARLYYLKIYDGDKLVRNFIPCYRISDKEIGLFDTVSGVFFTNQGTGTFRKGADV